MLSPSFVFDLETNMRMISSDHYQRLLNETWWQRVARVMPTQTRKERVNWMLETAKIEETDDGDVRFEDLVMQTYEVEHSFAGAGLEVNKTEFEDLGANGVDQATAWARQVGAQAAYWPQKVISKAILANPVTYDAKAFFATDHPVNPFNTDFGNYANLFTGSASGTYPGKLPIDSSVSLATAIDNLWKAQVYIRNIKTANGEDARNLKVDTLLVPPELYQRAIEITSAQYLAADSPNGTGGGSQNVEGLIRNLGLGTPVVANELGAAYGGTGTDYYLVCSEIGSDDLGAFAYLERSPFEVLYYGLLDDAQLGRMKKFQWEITGRNAAAPGHPFMMFKGSKT